MITRKEFKTTIVTAIGVVATASIVSFFTSSAELPAGAPREPLNGDLQGFEDVIGACKKPATCELPSLILVPGDSYTG